MLPDALAPFGDRLLQSLECGCKHFLRPFLIANYVRIIGFWSAEKPDHSITLYQGNYADNLIPGKYDQ